MVKATEGSRGTEGDVSFDPGILSNPSRGQAGAEGATWGQETGLCKVVAWTGGRWEAHRVALGSSCALGRVLGHSQGCRQLQAALLRTRRRYGSEEKAGQMQWETVCVLPHTG